MYSLTIHFGPNALQWQFLFKEKEKAESAYGNATSDGDLRIDDDFGQTAFFVDGTRSSILLEDLALVETARIQRALIDERVKAKFIKAATDDPIIKAAMRPQGPGVLTPMGGFRQN